MQMAGPDPIFSTAQVARKAGVHRDTIHRWLRDGRIPEPARDRRGWRVFSEVEVQRICLFATSKEIEQPQDPIIEKLAGLDWDFHGAKTSYLTHGLHPYPAKYIPQIPNALIQELSSVGETVLDIFCGSGTTLVEAQLLKRHSIGIDANPIACLISKAKVTRLSENDGQALFNLAAKTGAIADEIGGPTGDLFAKSGGAFILTHPRPDSESIDFWFEPFVIEELAAIRGFCRKLTEPSRTIALVAFSSIVVAVSKQDSDTRYVRREKGIGPGDTLRRFSRALVTTTKACLEFTDLTEDRFHATVIQEDVLLAPNVDQVDLLVCSPPYPNAYSYHLYHMTRMIWLDMDQPTFKAQEIGSHRKYSSRGKNGATISTFSDEFAKIFAWLRDHLRLKRYACLVVGDSTIRGERFDNAELLADLGESFGFREMARIERNLQSTKKAFNPKIGKIRTEKILIMKKH